MTSASLAGQTARQGDTAAGASSRRTAIEGRLQLLVAGLLAVYPWVRAFGPPSPGDAGPVPWPYWLAAVGLHALWLYARPCRRRWLPVLSLGLILGLITIQGLVVYRGVVTAVLNMDYTLLASLIHASARDPWAAPENLFRMAWARYYPPGSFFDAPGGFQSYVRGYFDPFMPMLERLFFLTRNPFLLQGLYGATIVSSALVVWGITLRSARLHSFQILMPVATLFHPTASSTTHYEFHNDGLPIGLLILGSYLFFTGRRRPAFLFLLLGTMTKVSYWPSWLMFGVVSALRREWRFAAAYFIVGGAAIGLFNAIQPTSTTPVIAAVFTDMGQSTGEIVVNLIISPHLWLDRVLRPERWYFLLCMLVPWGWPRLAYWTALAPVVPLVAFTMLEHLPQRSNLAAPYAMEYLAYVVPATLVALRSARSWQTVLIVVSVTVGAVAPFTFAGPWGLPAQQAYRWEDTFASATAESDVYFREVEIGTCAVGDDPVLAAGRHYPSYLRGDIERLWIDEGLLLKGRDRAGLPTFGTYVTPLPTTKPGWGELEDLRRMRTPDPAYAAEVRAFHQEIKDQFTVRVRTAIWEYHGGERLAACARQLGYQVE